MAKGRPQHRSMRGRPVDMDAMRAANGEAVAIGNAKMNARGDVLGRDGTVVVRREQIVQAYNRDNPQGVKHVSLKDAPPDAFETPAQALERLKQTGSNTSNDEPDNPANVMNKKQARKLLDKTD